MVERYLPWIRAQAKRVAQVIQGDHEEELVSAGVYGLLQAVRRYDPNRRGNSSVLLLKRAYGEIMDEAMRLGSPTKVATYRLWEYGRAVAELRREFGREPMDAELAEYLGVDERAIARARNVESIVMFRSLEGSNLGVDGTRFLGDKEVPSPEEIMEHNDRLEHLTKVASKLSLRERMVIVLRYYENLTFREIADILELSKVRVNQIHCAIIQKLREALPDFNEGAVQRIS